MLIKWKRRKKEENSLSHTIWAGPPIHKCTDKARIFSTIKAECKRWWNSER